MKKLALVALIIITVTRCKKDINNLKDDINGTWEIESSSSGWGGPIDYEPGNGNTISFNGSNYTQVWVYNDTTITTAGTFSISKGKPCGATESEAEQMLIRLDDNSLENIISVDDQKLSISSPPCLADGGATIYRRITP